MYGLNNLKVTINIISNQVSCPVCSCGKMVPIRDKSENVINMRFYCEQHEIYITPRTFIYKEEKENLLWHSQEDEELLNNIRSEKVKRECRMNYNNSEDALTWNVFRYLENQKILDSYFSTILNRKIKGIEVIYWSYSAKDNNVFNPLQRARNIFEYGKGSEPDIILVSYDTVIFLEAKFGSYNTASPKNSSQRVIDKYCLSENRLWDSLFTQNFTKIAVEEKKYELARFWLLGNWIAIQSKQKPLNFILLSLVREREEIDIEDRFSPLINQNDSRVFKRISWESIYNFIKVHNKDNDDKQLIIDYFKNKSLGYEKGRIKKAFNI